MICVCVVVFNLDGCMVFGMFVWVKLFIGVVCEVVLIDD